MRIESNKTEGLNFGLIRRLQRKLLSWYAENQRDLPWRKVKDPYPVWISEVMLQQTQVKTVIPYYLRFLESFPTMKDLASADLQRLLRVWAGLGYYSRARNLQKAAQEICRYHQGTFPETYDEVLALPGIGRYTAAAILSIAFDQRYAVLDGNVTRVLTRIFKLHGDPKSPSMQSHLWNVAQCLLPNRNPGDFNQAIMELGATLCSPRQPRCLLCPWQAECLARKYGLQESLPEKGRNQPTRKSHEAVVVIKNRGRVLIMRQKGQKLLRDFWGFPGIEFKRPKTLKSDLVDNMYRGYGLRICNLQPLTTIRHSITMRRILLEVFCARIQSGKLSVSRDRECKWVRLKDIDRYPLPSAALQIIKAIGTE